MDENKNTNHSAPPERVAVPRMPDRMTAVQNALNPSPPPTPNPQPTPEAPPKRKPGRPKKPRPESATPAPKPATEEKTIAQKEMEAMTSQDTLPPTEPSATESVTPEPEYQATYRVPALQTVEMLQAAVTQIISRQNILREYKVAATQAGLLRWVRMSREAQVAFEEDFNESIRDPDALEACIRRLLHNTNAALAAPRVLRTFALQVGLECWTRLPQGAQS